MTVIFTDRAPRPVGPYSQAIVVGPLVFCSGQIGLDPLMGKLVEGGSKEQTEQCVRNLQAVLKAAGCSLEDVVKTTIFVVDMGEFKEINEAYAKFFPRAPPARSTVGVAALPLNARVEIEAIASKR
jgi:2-iminobutanoate/2-iminopropanoate deaminase